MYYIRFLLGEQQQKKHKLNILNEVAFIDRVNVLMQINVLLKNNYIQKVDIKNILELLKLMKI